MMDAALEEWLASISGLDREGWWMPIVCAHGEALAEAEVIGVLFDHSEGHDLHWAPRAVPADDEGGVRFLIHVTRLDDVQRERVRAEGAQGQVSFGHGSINTQCTHGHTDRFTREQWDKKIAGARESSALAMNVFR